MRRCYGRRISRAYGKPHTCRQQRAAFTGGVTYSQPARTPTARVRIRWIQLVALAGAIAALAAALASRHTVPRTATVAAPGELARSAPRSEHGGALGEADGAVPRGATVFDGQVPGVARLNPALLSALRRAAHEAAHSGVEFGVDSGWRSPRYQEQLLRDAIAKYGSEAEALRWVAAPHASAHVKGDAVDLGSAAASWLSDHGAAYGLCRIFANEPWHYELRPQAVDDGCPAMYADPTRDPRMRR